LTDATSKAGVAVVVWPWILAASDAVRKAIANVVLI
jgi:hypothetical protein